MDPDLGLQRYRISRTDAGLMYNAVQADLTEEGFAARRISLSMKRYQQSRNAKGALEITIRCTMTGARYSFQ